MKVCVAFYCELQTKCFTLPFSSIFGRIEANEISGHRLARDSEILGYLKHHRRTNTFLISLSCSSAAATICVVI